MDIQKYFEENYPKAVAEFVRFTTPSYYEPNILYHPITNGMGCGFEGSNEPFKIINATYLKSGEMHIMLQSTWKSDHKIIINKSEIHTKLKKIDETVESKGVLIPNDKRVTYMTIDGVQYQIWQAYWRNHDKKTLGGRVTIRRSSVDHMSDSYGRQRHPYFELYSHFGSTWNLKDVHSHDSIGQEQYTFKRDVTVRQFKELVFGNADVKIKCELFGHL